METLLLVETSTALCSVALSRGEKVVAYRESETSRAHASLTAVYVDEVLREAGIGLRGCDAVCVSEGPGSYTGLRVGVSTAKGLCFGAGIPLIAVGTLDTLVWQAIDGGLVPEGCKYIVPMIDARRMEVYTAVFTADGKQTGETSPLVVEGDSFSRELSEGKVLFIGDGAEKCRPLLGGEKACFIQCCPKASSMLSPALAALRGGKFVDVAYFEPLYLKEFVATVSRRKLF